MKEDWLKFKKYPHIGKPLTSSNDKIWVKNYVQNPQNIIRHKFVPLLHRVLTQRKFRADESAIKNASGKRNRVNKGRKERHIYYPSHLYIATIIASSFKHTKNIYPRKTM